WQSRKRLKDIENLEAYLFISVRNEVTRYNKKNGRQNRVSLDELPVQLKITEEESPYDKISYKEMEQLLGKIIGELPEKCRLIFLMARQEQLKPKEIAERLCISENTVRVQMKIAIEKIIKQIKPYYPDLTLSLLWSFFFSSIS
ncbi:MAG: sigma-70 family RNA polymerase sigma factor, partial [Bacteroides intestinalis]|nr:sigma-70 family RNA polymerase sigma factor [Bacteroides intestinalis]